MRLCSGTGWWLPVGVLTVTIAKRSPDPSTAVGSKGGYAKCRGRGVFLSRQTAPLAIAILPRELAVPTHRRYLLLAPSQPEGE